MPVTRREAMMAALAAPALAAPGAMPQVDFGPHRVGRLIVGGNPISGTSHVSAELSREMVDYFTVANAKALLRRCEESGINVWQSRGDKHIVRLLREYRNEGGKILWVGQTASEIADVPRNIREMAAAGAIGIYHHGSRTDAYWASGKIDQALEMLKVMRDSGVRVGLGTHIPEVIDYAESKGWDLDFYMACVYNLSRTKEEASKLAGRAISDELFWDPDREEMLRRVRQTRKQCFIFKVYGASRKCDSEGQMRAAVGLARGYAKPSDCFVVGMYPKRTEQVAQNCRIFRDVLAANA